jgi:hypothetical protein
VMCVCCAVLYVLVCCAWVCMACVRAVHECVQCVACVRAGVPHTISNITTPRLYSRLDCRYTLRRQVAQCAGQGSKNRCRSGFPNRQNRSGKPVKPTGKPKRAVC